MFIADDPLLACLVRFVSASNGSGPGNEDFLNLQIRTLKRHLLQFPAEEQNEAAMAWVMEHAANYRRYWQRRTISEQTWALRCRDCPIADRGLAEHCEIHEQWLYLLRRYMQGEVRSRDYVENALSLLQANKDALIRRQQSLQAAGGREKACKPKKMKRKRQSDKSDIKQTGLKKGGNKTKGAKRTKGAKKTRKATLKGERNVL